MFLPFSEEYCRKWMTCYVGYSNVNNEDSKRNRGLDLIVASFRFKFR